MDMYMDMDMEMAMERESREYDEKYFGCLVNVCDRVQLFISEDDKDKVINLIQGCMGTSTLYTFLPNVMGNVSEYVAINCAEALLRGEAGLKFDINAPMPRGTFPLHHAASKYSIHLIDLYLKHGARTDVMTNGADLMYNGLLPLNVALEKLRYHDYLVDWTPKDSIFKLITILSLPQMRVPLEATKLLAQHTKETAEEFFLYAKDGYPLQMAVLLMVARDIVLSPFRSQDGLTLNGIMSLRRCIKEEIAALIQDEIDLAGKGRNSKPVKVFKDKRSGLFSALTLLDVFEKAGDAIDAYLRSDSTNKLSKDKVVEDVKSILVKAGFGLKKRDTDLTKIEWVTYDGWSSGGVSASGEFKKTTEEISQPLGQYLPPQSLQGGLTGKSIIDVREQKWAGQRFFPHRTPTLSSKTSPSKFLPPCETPSLMTGFGDLLRNGFQHLLLKDVKSPEATETQVKRGPKKVQQCRPYLPSIKQYPPLGYSLMKAVKRV